MVSMVDSLLIEISDEYLKGKVPRLLPVGYKMLWMMIQLMVSHLYHDQTLYDLMSMGYYYYHYCYQQNVRAHELVLLVDDDEEEFGLGKVSDLPY
jgi:hypothetical protein